MAREPTITFEQVAAAADALKGQGVRPTARAIRDTLGTGSMATILKFLQQWQGTQVRQSQTIDDTIDPSIARAISNQIAAKVQEATADATVRLADLQGEADTLIAENERQAADLETANADRAALVEKLATLSGTVAQLEADAKRTAADLATERQSSEAARIELAKMMIRVDNAKLVEAENDRLRASLETMQKSLSETERQLAIHKTEAQGHAQRYSDAVDELSRANAAHAAEIDRMQGFVAQATKDAAQAREALTRASEMLSNAQEQRAEESKQSAARIGVLEGGLKKQLGKQNPRTGG